MLFLPGAQGVEEPESDEFISCIKQLVCLVLSAVPLFLLTSPTQGGV